MIMFAAGALEIAHFSRGTPLMLEVGYFAIPAAVAVACPGQLLVIILRRCTNRTIDRHLRDKRQGDLSCVLAGALRR